MKMITITLVVPEHAVDVFQQLASCMHCGYKLKNTESATNTKTVLGQNLKKYRLMEDLTQRSVAKMIGVPQGHISQYELGKRWIPYQKACVLAKLFNTEIREFYRG